MKTTQRFRKALVFFMFMLLTAGLCCLPGHIQTADRHGGERAQSGSLLWRISGNGLDEPSYLYGTLHVVCREELVFPRALRGCLDRTGQLILELDLSDPHNVQRIQAGAVLPADMTLRGILDDADYLLLEEFLADSLGLEIRLVDRLKPMMLFGIFYPHLLRCHPQSYEMHLIELAREIPIEIVSLETAAEQIEAIDAIPLEEQARALVDLIANYEANRTGFKRMTELYSRWDLDGLTQLWREFGAGMTAFDEALIVRRNRKWAEMLPEHLARKPAFIAVGAVHLQGEEGLIRLLRDRGFHVDPVPIDGAQ